MTAPVLVAEAPTGTPATRVPARTRTDLRVVAVVAPPGLAADRDLTLDILAGLGKRDDVAGRVQHTQDDTALVPLWLAAHRTEWLVVTSPHVLTVPVLQLLPTLALPGGCRVLLACDPGTATGVREDLADYGAVTVAWDDTARLVPPPDPTPAARTGPGTEQEWGDRDLTLPREDWPRFRSECRRLLHPSTFDRVDRAYVDAYRECRSWLRQNPPQEQATVDLVGRIVGRTPDTDLAVVALRACQAAHMEAGWALRADLEQALAAISSRPVAFTDSQWRSLRAYRDPHRAAVVTLYQHGLTVVAMHALTVGDVAVDGSTVDGTPVDARGRDYLRAQRLRRQSDGHDTANPLLTDEPRRSVLAIRHAREDLGLRLGPGRVSATEHTAARWQRHLGLTLWQHS